MFWEARLVVCSTVVVGAIVFAVGAAIAIWFTLAAP